MLLSINLYSQGNMLGERFDNTAELNAQKITYTKHLIDVAPRKYVKFSDGSVFYIGKLVYQNYGFIPSDKTNTGVCLILYGYKVKSINTNGCLIYTLGDAGEIRDPMYIKDMKHSISDISYHRTFVVDFVKQNGLDFEYGTNTTKAEYIQYCKNVGLVLTNAYDRFKADLKEETEKEEKAVTYAKLEKMWNEHDINDSFKNSPIEIPIIININIENEIPYRSYNEQLKRAKQGKW